MAEITIDQTTVTIEATDTAVNVLPIVSQVVIETATSATLAVVDPINYDNATIGLNIGNNLTVVAGDLTTTQVLDDIDKIAFDTAAGATAGVGELAWNDTDGTLNLGLKGGNVTLQIGQELVQLVKDADNAGITNGAAYYLVGSDGSNVTVRKAQASTEPTSSKTFGIATESSSGGAKAFLTTFGMVRDIDTSALTEGAIVWLSPTVPGGLTTTKPSAPNHAVMLGLCVKSHANNGMVFVSVNNGLELDELHDVAITSVANNDLLAYESATSLWKNVQLSTLGDSRYARLGAANAFTVGGHTITNSAASVVPLSITRAVSQTAVDFQVLTDTGTVTYSNTSGTTAQTGPASIGTNTGPQSFNAQLYVQNNVATRIGQVIRGAASQSADLTQWQNSAGTILSRISSGGNFYSNGITGTASRGWLYPSPENTVAFKIADLANVNTVGLVIQGAPSQTADLTQWRNSAGGVAAGITAGGAGFFGRSTAFASTVFSVSTAAAGNKGMVIQAASGQTANVTEWQDSSGNAIARISNLGTSYANNFIHNNGTVMLLDANSGGILHLNKSTATQNAPGADKARFYLRDGTTAGTLKLVVRAGAAGAETTILDNIPQ